MVYLIKNILKDKVYIKIVFIKIIIQYIITNLYQYNKAQFIHQRNRNKILYKHCLKVVLIR